MSANISSSSAKNTTTSSGAYNSGSEENVPATPQTPSSPASSAVRNLLGAADVLAAVAEPVISMIPSHSSVASFKVPAVPITRRPSGTSRATLSTSEAPTSSSSSSSSTVSNKKSAARTRSLEGPSSSPSGGKPKKVFKNAQEDEDTESSINSFDLESAHLQAKIAELSNHKLTLEINLSNAQERISALDRQVQALGQDNIALLQQVNQLNAQYTQTSDAMESQRQKSLQQIQDLTSQLQQARTLEKQLREMEAAVTQERAKRLGFESDYNNLAWQLRNFEAQANQTILRAQEAGYQNAHRHMIEFMLSDPSFVNGRIILHQALCDNRQLHLPVQQPTRVRMQSAPSLQVPQPQSQMPGQGDPQSQPPPLQASRQQALQQQQMPNPFGSSDDSNNPKSNSNQEDKRQG